MFENGQREILDEICKSYMKGRLIPFIGAGFSKNIANFPDWNRFVRGLGEELKKLPNYKDKDIDIIKSFRGNNIQATEAFIFMIGKADAPDNTDINEVKEKGYTTLSSRIHDQFSKIAYNDTWTVHTQLMNMNFNKIYTTNWDPVIERTYEEIYHINNYYPITNYKSFLDFLEKKEKAPDTPYKEIIKFHGDYREPKSLIAIESDYLRRIAQRSFLDVKLEHDLMHNDFLFMGFSFDDIFIKYVLFQVNMLRSRSDIKSGSVPGNQPKVFLISVEERCICKENYFQSQGIKMYYLFKDIVDKRQIKAKYEIFLKSIENR